MRAAAGRAALGWLAALAASLTWAAEPTSPQTRVEIIRLVDTLEKQPDHPQGREMRRKVLTWLTEAPDVSVTVCEQLLGIKDFEPDGPGGELLLQAPFAEAKFILENPDKAHDIEAVHLAGIEGALRTYAAMKARDAKLEIPAMEELVKLQAEQKLSEHVSRISKKCQ